ncbi:caspase family protein [Marinospirillum celere]|uniref:caspase family protein n=1 Tax=Marinospirillum celere TaxID=1122252 RepID=UPI0015A5B8C0|nr:caspase family protein [Marinospirillum celere]
MRDLKFILQPKYEASRALVVGINQYKNASPLGYAVNDAHEVSELLVEELGVEKGNVTYLADQEATKSNILKSFLRFSNDDVKVLAKHI